MKTINLSIFTVDQIILMKEKKNKEGRYSEKDGLDEERQSNKRENKCLETNHFYKPSMSR